MSIDFHHCDQVVVNQMDVTKTSLIFILTDCYFSRYTDCFVNTDGWLMHQIKMIISIVNLPFFIQVAMLVACCKPCSLLH